MWRRRALAPALASILAAAALAEVPVVDVTRHGAPPAQGVSDTFLGSEGGRTAVYKPNAPIGMLSDGTPWMKTGNLSGEWLGTRVMNDLGVSSPQVDMVRVRGEAVPYARIQHMQELFPGQQLAQGIHGLPKGAVLDLDAMRRMQAVDLLIGNTDRHGTNVWFHQDKLTGRWKPIAFDHNLAMATTASTGNDFTAFQEAMTGRSKSGVEAPNSQTRGIWNRNSVYRGVMNDPRAAQGLLAEARHVQATLTDARIDQLVDAMPDEAIGPDDKAARRQELKDHLKRRRGELVRTAEATLRNHPAYVRTEWRLQGLPEDLRAHLPADLE
ncbi:MAG: CotH kinase family protein, partial [Myxococcales bacterium]|nr:CotH kinase family protein [Myxococcales bacterium]